VELIYIATFLVALISSLLSGAAGGGGGFIMAPYWLLVGLTPAQGATTGAFMALGMGGSSLAAFKGSEHMPTQSKRFIYALLAITLVTSAVGPFFLHTIQTEVFKPVLAVFTLLSLPILFFNRKIKVFSRRNQIIGFGLLVLLLLASSFITSSLFSILIAIVLSQLFSMSILQGTVIRRIIGIAQSGVIFIILFWLGNFVWQHALAGILGGIIGSYLGTRFAIKRGENFAKYMLVAGASISSILLLI
jgi:uncharacterized membrane protein YfcA